MIHWKFPCCFQKSHCSLFFYFSSIINSAVSCPIYLSRMLPWRAKRMANRHLATRDIRSSGWFCILTFSQTFLIREMCRSKSLARRISHMQHSVLKLSEFGHAKNKWRYSDSTSSQTFSWKYWSTARNLSFHAVSHFYRVTTKGPIGLPSHIISMFNKKWCDILIVSHSLSSFPRLCIWGKGESEILTIYFVSSGTAWTRT